MTFKEMTEIISSKNRLQIINKTEEALDKKKLLQSIIMTREIPATIFQVIEDSLQTEGCGS
jgi:hypothetical protein